MSGISLSGLINGSFNWQSVVTQLIQIDSAPVTTLQNDEATNNTKLSAFSQLSGDVTSLQTASQALQADGLFNGVSAASTTANSTWSTSAASGTALGNYTIAVSNLATAASLDGASNIATGLSATSDVSGLTLATLPTATAPTAGNFSVDGQQVTVALTDSLSQVFAKISAATGGNVTAAYDPASDKITLTSGDGSPIVLGAANDTSNFLSAVRLANTGTATISSSTRLGSTAVTSPLLSARLGTAVTGTDSTGAGSFTVNGVSIAYNVNTDSLNTVLGRINNSAAGVTASYDPASDRVILTNNSTGDQGIGVADTTGTLMASLGLTSAATLVHGQNAVFTINGGGAITSQSNTLDASVTGIPGLTVGINSETSQTISVAPNSTAMNTAIQSFISAYNTLQSDITGLTQITTSVTGTVTTSVLSGNQEVPQWAQQLSNLAFNALSGVSGTVQKLDDIGIGFTGISQTLSVTDQNKLNTALSTNPSAVGTFFQAPNTGFAARLNTFLSGLLLPNTGGLAVETAALNSQNTTDQDKITALQAQLAAEQTSLTNEFLAMQTAQAQAQQEQQILNNMFGGSSSGSSSSSSTQASASVVPSSSTATTATTTTGTTTGTTTSSTG